MSQLTQPIIRQLQRHYQQPVLRTASGSWYSGADVLEDIRLCTTSFRQQNVHAGQAVLISATATSAIPSLLLASWQLGLTVTLKSPEQHLPTLTPQAYAAMIYSADQINQLAGRLDPHQISVLTLILNTAPNFSYLVHDCAESMKRQSRPDLILPAHQLQLTQAAVYERARHRAPQTTLTSPYDLEAGLIPCLSNLLTGTPFTMTTTQNAPLPN
ncbi:hypothetical protein [Lactiplantibacillus plajomi]|uniref:AMP-dependent synthetase/ligase domain-containing protein n=1 Tax=Lactiplantibacillus plajomi TaxID=1457217 RepID=A0ABV6K3L9_9LACO|nr:hypothetical protein [Lactiplantibacillus plajomi]